MRNTILAALALTTLVSSVRHADACGGSYNPEPVVYRLSSHHVLDRDPSTARTRTFALIEERAPADLSWSQISPMSYDRTEIAEGAPFTKPVTLTLVGPSGTRVVSSTRHVFLSRTWHFDGDRGAVEVPGLGQSDFAIALSGTQTTAKWRALEETTTPSKAKLAAWVKAQGVTPFDVDSIYTRRIAGSDVETVTLFPDGGTKMITLVRRGTKQLGRFEGSALGAFELHGVTRLVLADGASVQSVWL